MSELNTEILIGGLVCLILLSGFFSGSETGMMSLNRYRLRHLARKGRPNAKRVLTLLERPDRLLGVILIGNTFANILASAVATVLAVHYFGDLGVAIATIVLTLVVLIFAETAPKTLAALRPEFVAYRASLPLKWMLKIFYPLVWLVNSVANSVLRLFRVRVKKRAIEPLSAEELSSLVLEAKGKISSTYQEMLLRILALEQITVEDVMVPRNDIVAIDMEDAWEVIFARIIACEHASIPLYREDINHVFGILNLRRVLAHMQKNTLQQKEDLLALAEPVYFVPEGALMHRQLLNFQDQQKSVGLVVDEYGDVQGLVTLQDVVEEIVGEFSQDVDETARHIKPQPDGSFVVDAMLNVRDLNRQMSWNLPIDGPKTLGGLLIEYLEMIPTAGIAARVAGYPMQVLKVNRNRIKTIQVWPGLATHVAETDESTS